MIFSNFRSVYLLCSAFVFLVVCTVSPLLASFEPGKDIQVVWKKPAPQYKRSNYWLAKTNGNNLIFVHSHGRDPYEKSWSFEWPRPVILVSAYTSDTMKTLWEQQINLGLKDEVVTDAVVISSGAAVTLVVETRFSDNDSATIRGIIIDASNGKITTNKEILRCKRNDNNKRYFSRCASPDSTYVLFSRYDYNPYYEDDKLEVKAELIRVDRSLSSIVFDTVVVPLTKEFSELPNWGMNNDDLYIANYLPYIGIDDAGAVYQVGYTDPNMVSVYKWALSSRVSKVISLSVDKVNTADRDMTFYRSFGQLERGHPGVLHVAGGCLADDHTVIDRYYFATFDFNAEKITQQWVHTPSPEKLEELLDVDEMNRFRVERIEVHPTDKSVLLICEEDQTEETYDVYMDSRNRMRKTAPYIKRKTKGFLFLSLDASGTPKWTSGIKKEAEGRTYWHCASTDSSRRLFYYDNDKEGFVESVFDTRSGKVSSPKLIAELDNSTAFNILEMFWAANDTVIILVGDGDDEEDMYFMKLTGL